MPKPRRLLSISLNKGGITMVEGDDVWVKRVLITKAGKPLVTRNLPAKWVRLTADGLHAVVAIVRGHVVSVPVEDVMFGPE